MASFLIQNYLYSSPNYFKHVYIYIYLKLPRNERCLPSKKGNHTPVS